MTRFRRWVLLAAALLLASCNCSKVEKVEAQVEVEPQPVPDDGSELSKFHSKKKSKRKRKKAQASIPPTREEGQAALDEARLLLEEAEFRDAEAELRIAAGAGIAGADDLLARVRAEIAAEDLIISAQKKMNAHEFADAKRDLSKVPNGLILSAIAKKQLARLHQAEEEARRQVIERVSDRLDPDGGSAADDE